MDLEKYVKLLKSKLNDEITDIVIFGSSVKGRLKPRDIDVVVISDGAAQRSFDDLREELNIIFVSKEDLIKTHIMLKQAIIHEGHSIRYKKPIRELLGFESFTLFRFTISELKQTDKVRFVQALYGRGKGGLLQELGGEKIAAGAVLVPVEKESEFEDFLRLWKLPYSKERWMQGIK